MDVADFANELSQLFIDMCKDTSEPMVRRRAASELRAAADAFTEFQVHEPKTIDAFVKLLSSDEQESIRVNGLKSSPARFIGNCKRFGEFVESEMTRWRQLTSAVRKTSRGACASASRILSRPSLMRS